MKKLFLLQLLLVSMACGLYTTANAQYNLQTLGARLVVNTPFALQGTKKFTYSSDPAYTGPWGGSLTAQFYYHQPLVHITDSLVSGKLSLTDSAKVHGKWALVFRGGGFFFSDKAYYCFKAGALGVIIVNNQPGADPIGMAANTANLNYTAITCPVLMVSNPDGLALNNALYAGLADTISLSQWGFNLPHDLAMVPGASPTPYMGAVPFSQMTANGGQVSQYQMYSGGTVANIGTTAETNVRVYSNVYFTPTGGAQSLVHADTIALSGVTAGTVAVSDSVVGGFSNTIYHPTPTGNGRYDVLNYTTFNNADSDAPDDTIKSYSYVTDSVFCSSRWDAVNSRPISTRTIGFNSGGTTYGPLFYMNDGPYQAVQVQFGVNDGDTTHQSLALHNSATTTFVTMFKWIDGSNGYPEDSVMEIGELVLEGIASKTYTTADSNDKKFIVPLTGPSGTAGTKAYVSKNFFYYFATDITSSDGLTLDADAYTNYFGRTYASKNIGGKTVYFAPVVNDDVTYANYASNPGSFAMIPFIQTSAGVNFNDIDSVGINNISLLNTAPSFAFYTSKTHQGVGVANVEGAKPSLSIYPNPATGTDIHVKLDLVTRSSSVTFSILDGFGRSVYKTTMHNLQNDVVTFPTSSLPAGRYYVAMRTDDGTTALPFTVLAK